MIDMASWRALVVLVSQIMLETCHGFPLLSLDDAVKGIAMETTQARFKRSSLYPTCQSKTHLTKPNGVIASPRYKTLHERSVSCSWLIHASRGQRVKLEFSEFNIEDTCPGICSCNYVLIKERTQETMPVFRKYCNDKKPPRLLISTGERVKVHLRLTVGTKFQNNGFTITYTRVSSGDTRNVPSEKVATRTSDGLPLENMAQYTGEKLQNLKARVRKVIPTIRGVASTSGKPSVAVMDNKEVGPSKLTVLLAVAIPVVMIFIFVVLVIAYYNHAIEKRQLQAREDIVVNSGSTLSDLILNTSATLTPMFNLKKARRESSDRREKANRLYDDMLQNWKAMNANRIQRLQAKQESVNVWESYQASRKQRRGTRDSDDRKAFAMLVSNAINVGSSSSIPDIEELDKEEAETKPRPSSILINRIISDDICHKRGSKVLSWSDLSTKSKDDKVLQKRSISETELKIRGSGNIPAIVVSQPSFETEDDESEANDTDKLIKDTKMKKSTGAAEKKDSPDTQPKNSKPTYSCSEHVKDILRESYGEEVEEWFPKPKKSQSQDSLKDTGDQEVKYTAIKTEDDDID